MCAFFVLALPGRAAISSLVVRTGQGGFSDNRSPLGKLGGGQIALDIIASDYPLALSFSTDYYTNSASPSAVYEISDMVTASLFYTRKFGERVRIFTGGGGGWLKVLDGAEDEISAPVFTLE
ncbi:MAG: hypothetical protein GY852_01045, partial [bacterium]|nr:hypothetical protein [bacterium]